MKRFLILFATSCSAVMTPMPQQQPAPQPAAPAAPASFCFPDDVPLTPVAGMAGFVEPGGAHLGKYWVCDLPDRTVLVDRTTDRRGHFPGEAITIPRTRPDQLAHARLGATSNCADDCGDANDGAAGCSERTTCWLSSPLPGAKSIETGYPEDRPLGTLADVDNEACAPMPDDSAIAMCATSTRSVFISGGMCEDHGRKLDAEVFDGDHLRASLEDEAAPEPDHVLTGIAPTSDGTTFTYTFHDPDATLTFDRGDTPGAIFTFDGRTEDCRVFAIDGD